VCLPATFVSFPFGDKSTPHSTKIVNSAPAASLHQSRARDLCSFTSTSAMRLRRSLARCSASGIPGSKIISHKGNFSYMIKLA